MDRKRKRYRVKNRDNSITENNEEMENNDILRNTITIKKKKPNYMNQSQNIDRLPRINSVKHVNKSKKKCVIKHSIIIYLFIFNKKGLEKLKRFIS